MSDNTEKMRNLIQQLDQINGSSSVKNKRYLNENTFTPPRSRIGEAKEPPLVIPVDRTFKSQTALFRYIYLPTFANALIKGGVKGMAILGVIAVGILAGAAFDPSHIGKGLMSVLNFFNGLVHPNVGGVPMDSNNGQMEESEQDGTAPPQATAPTQDSTKIAQRLMMANPTEQANYIKNQLSPEQHTATQKATQMLYTAAKKAGMTKNINPRIQQLISVVLDSGSKTK
jgi:hypothetical protein